MPLYYPELSSASDWLKKKFLHPIRSTTQIWVVTRHQYRIPELITFLKRHFIGKPVVVSRNIRFFLRLCHVTPAPLLEQLRMLAKFNAKLGRY